MNALQRIVCSGCGKLLAEIRGTKGSVERKLVSFGFAVDGPSLKSPGDTALAVCQQCGAKTPFEKKAFLEGF